MRGRACELALALIPLIALLASPLARPALSAYDGPLYFDGRRAYDHLRELCSKFKRRVVGSSADAAAGLWVAEKLRELGYEVHAQNFTARSFGGFVSAMNVYAVKRGEVSRYVVLMAHRDVVPSTVEGANDNGAGVAILLELARVLANRSTRLSVIFLCTDAEETGLHGARHFVRSFPEASRIVCAISIDMCGWRGARGIALFAYYSPPAFSDASVLLLALSASTPECPVAVDLMDQVMARLSLIYVGTDSMPFVAAGVPAIGITDDPTYPYWHTPEDTVDKVSPERLEAVGRFLERLVLTVDGMGGLPRLGTRYLASNWVYLPEPLVRGVSLAVLALAVFTVLTRVRPSKRGLLSYLVLYLGSLASLALLTALCAQLGSFAQSLPLAAVAYVAYAYLVVAKLRPDVHGLQGVALSALAGAYLPASLIAPEATLALAAPAVYSLSLARPVRRGRMLLAAALAGISLAPLALVLQHVYELLGAGLADRVLCYAVLAARQLAGGAGCAMLSASASLVVLAATACALSALKRG